MKFTKGKHQFVVSTHVDKAHIHNHVEFNSTNLECDGKFNNYKNSSFALRRLNDQICREHGYSVIENPKAKGQRYQEKAAAKRGRSFKERLRQTIDRVRRNLPRLKRLDDAVGDNVPLLGLAPSGRRFIKQLAHFKFFGGSFRTAHIR